MSAANSFSPASEFRRFFNTTVPLARMERRVWTGDETFRAEVEIAHFGAMPLPNAVACWKLLDAGGCPVAKGKLPAKTLQIGRGTPLGTITVDLSRLAAPARLRLLIELDDFANDWTIWLYPSRLPAVEPQDILIATTLDAPALARLDAGGKVLLLATRLSAVHPRGSFTPVFWNRQWFPNQSCQTLGLLCDLRHPALAGFPTDGHSDWQWEDIVLHSRSMVLDDMPRALRPIVQVIDDWNTNRKLGLVFECRVGRGKLLVCSADLEKDVDRRPAARQLRASLLAYMAGKTFNPPVTVGKDALAKLLRPAASTSGPSVLKKTDP